MSDKFNIVSGMTRLDTIDANSVAVGCVARSAAVKIMHREGCVRRDLVETLTTIDGFFNRVLVVEDLVPWKRTIDMFENPSHSKTGSSALTYLYKWA